jgi:Glycosyltransferase family 87
VMLALQRRWRVFFSASVCVVLLSLVAGLAFGFDLYGAFVTHIGYAQSAMEDERIPPQTYASLYGVAIALGAPQVLAATLHALSAIAAFVCAVLVFRRNARASSAVALTAGTLLLSPYLFFYDSLLLVVASAALLPRVQERGAAAVMVAGFLAGAVQLWVGHALPLPIVWAASWAMLLYALKLSAPAGSAAVRPAQ